MWKQYQERTTLCIWPLRMQERDAEWSAPTIACHIHGTSVPLGMTVAWRYDVLWDWLWDACHMVGVHWGSHCKGFCSKEDPDYCFEQSARNPTINLIHEFGNPYPSSSVLLSRAYAMQESGAWEFLWGGKEWFAFAQQTFAPETFGKRQKGGRSPVVSLLPGFLWASRFKKPTRSVPETWGHTYNLLPRSAKGTRQRVGILYYHAAKKGTKKIVSRELAKIQEWESSD